MILSKGVDVIRLMKKINVNTSKIFEKTCHFVCTYFFDVQNAFDDYVRRISFCFLEKFEFQWVDIFGARLR